MAEVTVPKLKFLNSLDRREAWKACSDLRQSGSDLRQSGSDLRQSDSDLMKFDPDLMKFDPDLMKSDSDLMKFDSDLMKSDSDLMKFDPDLMKFGSDLMKFDSNCLKSGRPSWKAGKPSLGEAAARWYKKEEGAALTLNVYPGVAPGRVFAAHARLIIPAGLASAPARAENPPAGIDRASAARTRGLGGTQAAP